MCVLLYFRVGAGDLTTPPLRIPFWGDQAVSGSLKNLMMTGVGKHAPFLLVKSECLSWVNIYIYTHPCSIVQIGVHTSIPAFLGKDDVFDCYNCRDCRCFSWYPRDSGDNSMFHSSKAWFSIFKMFKISIFESFMVESCKKNCRKNPIYDPFAKKNLHRRLSHGTLQQGMVNETLT